MGRSLLDLLLRIRVEIYRKQLGTRDWNVREKSQVEIRIWKLTRYRWYFMPWDRMKALSG